MTAMSARAALVFSLAVLALPLPWVTAPAEASGLPLTISPSPTTMPTTTVGNQSQAVEILLGNDDEEAAAIEKTYLEGGDADQFFFNGSNCGSLGQGQKCAVWLGLRPGSSGDKETTLHVTFSDGRAEETFPVSGAAAEPQLAFQPGDYDFGTQRVNGGYETTFQLANIGAAGVQFNGFDFAGPDASAFWTGSSNCWGQWLEPGQSCAVQVGFNPRDTVPYAATLRANVNGASFTAGLAGRGGRAIVEAAANPFSLGAATVDSDGGVGTVTMTNSGDLPALFFIAVIAGGDAGSFRLLDENCSAEPLQPGASCSAHVRFFPQRPGALAARLAFFGDGDAGTMVVLRGEGLEPRLGIDPEHDFGRQKVDSRGAPHTFAIRNAGSAPVDLGPVALNGRDLDQFVIAGDSCAGATLAAGDSCAVAVRFSPDSRGGKAALLRVHSGSETLTAYLRGAGVEEGVSARARRAFVRRTALNAARARCHGAKRCQPHLGLSRAARALGR
jgi:HYDIN/CFA65/VesB-like, Ig-like domain